MKPHPSDLLVLAGEDDLAAIPVEGGGQDELGQGEVDEALPGADVPHADIVVAAAGEEDVLGGGVNNRDVDKFCRRSSNLGGGVPHHNAHSPLVEVQVHNAATGGIELNKSYGKTGHRRFL